jgi:hypothetical protein
MNQAGIDQLYAQVAAKIERVDKELRATHTGQPADEVEPIAKAAFAAIGFPLPNIRGYAESIEQDQSFKIVLS